MKTKKYTNIKIASVNGIFHRLITQPLSQDEIGQEVIIVTNRKWGNMIFTGTLLDVGTTAIMLRVLLNTIFINPEVVIGWTTTEMCQKDAADKQFKSRPEIYCIPGTFDPEGTIV